MSDPRPERPTSEADEALIRSRIASASKSRLCEYPQERLVQLLDDARDLGDLLDWERGQEAAAADDWRQGPIVCAGIAVCPLPTLNGERILYAEVMPAGSRWLPKPGRTSRWWYEVHARHAADGHGCDTTTYAYIEGGSGGAFTFRGCVERASRAVLRFVDEEDEKTLQAFSASGKE